MQNEQKFLKFVNNMINPKLSVKFIFSKLIQKMYLIFFITKSDKIHNFINIHVFYAIL